MYIFPKAFAASDDLFTHTPRTCPPKPLAPTRPMSKKPSYSLYDPPWPPVTLRDNPYPHEDHSDEPLVPKSPTPRPSLRESVDLAYISYQEPFGGRDHGYDLESFHLTTYPLEEDDPQHEGEPPRSPSRASTLVAWPGKQPQPQSVTKMPSGRAGPTSPLNPSIPLDPAKDPFLVAFDPDDTRHPFNWSSGKKWTVLVIVCLSAVCVTVASSIQASTYSNLEDEFGIPRIEAVAGVSLYVLGFGIGARE